MIPSSVCRQWQPDQAANAAQDTHSYTTPGGTIAFVTLVYVDADACPVREEVYRVAGRLGVGVLIVSNGSRPIRPPGLPNVRMVMVGEAMDAPDDWIAERIDAADIC